MTESLPSETVLKAPSRRLFLNGLSLGTFVSPGDYRSHWKSTFCTTTETLTSTTRDTDSHSDRDGQEDEEEEDCCSSNRLSALFEHDTESLSIVWKQSESLHWKMEIAFESLADKVLIVSRQGRTIHLFLFLANRPKIYRGKPQHGVNVKFHQRFLDSFGGAYKVAWERECCFDSCDRQTFGASNVLHLKLMTLTQHLNTLIRRLELMDFAVYYSNPVMTDTEKSRSEDLQWPTFQTFDASYSWFCLQLSLIHI